MGLEDQLLIQEEVQQRGNHSGTNAGAGRPGNACQGQGRAKQGVAADVHRRAGKGAQGVAEEMGKNQLVNPPGVMNHPEMGAFVLLNINRADFLLVKGNALILEGQQHIGLIFKPIAVNLREMFEETGADFSSSSDTEVIVKLIARGYKKGLERALTDTIQMIKGSFAICVMTKDALIGARDPNGIRPLCLGQVRGGWVLASESCAIDAMNGTFVRDIHPGEIVIINKDGVLSFEFGEKTSKRSCIFEYVYFARPDSIIDDIPVQEARYKMGAQLAKESPVEADVVVGVPDSGLGAAIGYSRESGIPYAMGVVKNKYIGRTFIAPTQQARENMVFVKLNALKSDLDGKRVVVIDDSIVRGTTSRRLVQILRRAGAKEVHFRVSSAPVKFPCYLGIDTPTKEELISSGHDVEEIRKEIGADSLAFISVDGMFEALRACNPEQYGFCKGCFTGEYPMRVPGELIEKKVN